MPSGRRSYRNVRPSGSATIGKSMKVKRKPKLDKTTRALLDLA